MAIFHKDFSVCLSKLLKNAYFPPYLCKIISRKSVALQSAPIETAAGSINCKRVLQFDIVAQKRNFGGFQMPLQLNPTTIVKPLLISSVTQRRFKSRKVKRNSKNEQADSDEEADDEDDDEDDNAVDENEGSSEGYKDKIIMSSLRADSVASAGLNLSRISIEEAFYANRLMVNGQKILKKSRQLEVGDYVDVIANKLDDKLTVKRVLIKQILQERSATVRNKITVRAWKKAFEIDNTDN